MEGDGHDAVCSVESFLDAITVVNINIDVKHTLVDTAIGGRKLSEEEHEERMSAGYHGIGLWDCSPKELEDSENDVVDVTETRGLGFFGVV